MSLRHTIQHWPISDASFDVSQAANAAVTVAFEALRLADEDQASKLTALNSAKTAYDDAVSTRDTALTALNNANSAYDAQLVTTNGLIDERAEIEFDLAGARLGVLMVVTNTIASESIEVDGSSVIQHRIATGLRSM